MQSVPYANHVSVTSAQIFKLISEIYGGEVPGKRGWGLLLWGTKLAGLEANSKWSCHLRIGIGNAPRKPRKEARESYIGLRPPFFL